MCKNILELMCTNILLKRYVCQHCVALKTGKRTTFLCVLIEIIDGNYIFNICSANVSRRPKVGKRTPPPLKSGGLNESISFPPPPNVRLIR